MYSVCKSWQCDPTNNLNLANEILASDAHHIHCQLTDNQLPLQLNSLLSASLNLLARVL